MGMHVITVALAVVAAVDSTSPTLPVRDLQCHFMPGRDLRCSAHVSQCTDIARTSQCTDQA